MKLERLIFLPASLAPSQLLACEQSLPSSEPSMCQYAANKQLSDQSRELSALFIAGSHYCYDSHRVASHADVLRRSSRVPTPLTSADLSVDNRSRLPDLTSALWTFRNFALVSGAGTRDEPLRTSAWETSHRADIEESKGQVNTVLKHPRRGGLQISSDMDDRRIFWVRNFRFRDFFG